MKYLLTVLTQVLFTLTMYVMGSAFFGAALVPGLALFFKVWAWTGSMEMLPRLFLLGASLAMGYFLFGFTLIILVGLFRSVLNIRLKEGNHPIFSFEAMKWAFVSSLYLMINFTFIDFILLTPFANLLFRLLGAKLGKNVQFNSRHVYDATLIEIGSNTVVGGGAIILGHIVERGLLKLKKVRIGRNVTIGSHSTIMPGCEIEDGAIIGASAVLLKDTKVGRREIWFGIPAQVMRRHERPPKDDGPSDPPVATGT
ncbi:MAG: DapH/DapD/GlmU-related protein [Candidatus Omnitrophota bacterium]|nr:DapH/DapD/GlmU-related protein [Candidatus Omnitrophota bacterium]MDZ4242342.1 DapH/DapD/GlmU-related protein [Candidatus Omnitrophota bacterium]